MKIAVILPEAFVTKLARQGLGLLLLSLDILVSSTGDNRALYRRPGLHWGREYGGVKIGSRVKDPVYNYGCNAEGSHAAPESGARRVGLMSEGREVMPERETPCGGELRY
jgi:hypothetical protein